jgi:hypothetical protein
MSTSKQSRVSLLAVVQALIAGTQKQPPSGEITLGNVAYTALSLVQLLESLGAAMTAQAATEATAKDAVLATRAAETKVRPVVTAYKKYLQTTYGNATQTLAVYGLAPAKTPKPLTVEAKSAKVAAGLATRKARGTVGPKKRLEIKGTVEKTAEPVPAEPSSAPAKPTA